MYKCLRKYLLRLITIASLTAILLFEYNTKISFEENKNIFDAYDFVEKIHQNVMLFWQSFSI